MSSNWEGYYYDGRICGWGKHFADAERDNAYPIEVFRLRQDMTPNTELSVPRPLAAEGSRSNAGLEPDNGGKNGEPE